MVTFEQTMSGYSVYVDNKLFGWIDKERRFFTDPTVIKEFIQLSPSDLREIADKAEACHF